LNYVYSRPTSASCRLRDSKITLAPAYSCHPRVHIFHPARLQPEVASRRYGAALGRFPRRSGANLCRIRDCTGDIERPRGQRGGKQEGRTQRINQSEDAGRQRILWEINTRSTRECGNGLISELDPVLPPISSPHHPTSAEMI
jgi:hypothetical protein